MIEAITNIFISYRHADQIIAIQIAENLRQQVNGYVFFDERSIDQVDFERSILLHMRQSDIVLIIVTEHTFALERIAKNDDWIRRELREALQLNKQIVPVCIYPSTLPGYPLPFDIAAIMHMHTITLYPGNRIFDASMQNLIDFIHRIAGMQGENLLQKTREALIRRDYISAQQELDKIRKQLAIYAEPRYVARGAFYQALILLNKNRPCVQTLPLIRKVGDYMYSAIQQHRISAYLFTLSLFKRDFSRHGLPDYKAEANRLLTEAQSLPWTQEDNEILAILKICQPDLSKDYLKQV